MVFNAITNTASVQISLDAQQKTSRNLELRWNNVGRWLARGRRGKDSVPLYPLFLF